MSRIIFKALVQAMIVEAALLWLVAAADDYEPFEGGPLTDPPTSGGWVDYSDEAQPPSPLTAPAPVEATFPGDDREFLRCAKKVSGNCGGEIFEYVFSGGEYPGFDCCKELVSMGRLCHDLLTNNVIAKVPALGTEIEKEHRDEQVWSYCLDKEA